MKTFLCFMLLTAACHVASATDLTVTYKMKGGGGKEKTVYWTDQYQLTVNKDEKQDVLVDYNQATIYTIDHAKKQITYIKMGDMAGMMGGMNQMVNQAMNMPMPKGQGTVGDKMQKDMTKAFGDPEAAQLQKLGQVQIAGRTCDNYMVERKGKSIGMVEEVCIDTTLQPPGANLPEASQLSGAADEMMSGALSGVLSTGQKELAAIKGLTLRRKTKTAARGAASIMSFGMGKQSSEEEAVLVKEGPVDVALFKLPSGYQSINQMEEMQKQMQDLQQQLGGMKNQQ